MRRITVLERSKVVVEAYKTSVTAKWTEEADVVVPMQNIEMVAPDCRKRE